MEEKRQKVFGVFETISPVYDAANRRISLGLQTGWKHRFVRQLTAATTPGDRVLDVCCGTGDIAIALAKEGRQAWGLDFSPAMLRLAEEKSENIPGLHWRQGDAMALPFGDGEFDAASISFGLRNTTDYTQVLREMRRVVRPGGWVACLDSFVPSSPLVRPFYELYFHFVMPLLGGGWHYRREYLWLWQSTKEFLTSEQLMELFRDIGLQPLGRKHYLFGACAAHLGQKPVDPQETSDKGDIADE